MKVMTFNEICNMPSQTPNTQMYELFKEHAKNELAPNPDLFASAQLIAWAIENKKYDSYYTHFNGLEGNELHVEEKHFINRKKVIVVTNVLAECTFGFLGENDGDSTIIYPKKDGLYEKYI